MAKWSEDLRKNRASQSPGCRESASLHGRRSIEVAFSDHQEAVRAHAMPSAKRRHEVFDPNKSDSDDVDFAPESSRPRKSAKKSRSSTKKTAPARSKSRKRSGYAGSDVSEDFDDDESEDSLANSTEGEEEVEMNPATGRRVRKASNKTVKYDEASGSEDDDLLEDHDDDEQEPQGELEEQEEAADTSHVTRKNTRKAPLSGDSEEPASPERPFKKIITLKYTPRSSRVTRAESVARSTRATSVGSVTAPTRRSTRAHTEEGDEPIALSNSGKHVIRASRSPEPIMTGRARTQRGSISTKKPFTTSTIKEEIHESSSYEEDKQLEQETIRVSIPGTVEDTVSVAAVDAHDATEDAMDEDEHVNASAEAEIEPVEGDVEIDEDDEDIVVTSRARGGRRASKVTSEHGSKAAVEERADETRESQNVGRQLRNRSSKKSGQEQSSDFEPVEDGSEEEISASDREGVNGGDSDSSQREHRRSKSKGKGRRTINSESDGDELDADELAEEAYELRASRSSKRRRPRTAGSGIEYAVKTRRERKQVDYSIKPLDQIYAEDEEVGHALASAESRPRAGRSTGSQRWQRVLHSTFGPFGGGTGPPAVAPGPWGDASADVDSDSSDEENMKHAPDTIQTPTTAKAKKADAMATGGTPANFGKIKSQKALADADPLGVDQNVDFTKVGGLQGHIDQLKEMVQMPLLYPELFLRFGVTPPRGVLFHGPPGTGKTLLARALAAQSSQNGQKITFYMRKGADALSKWVGEAERQLRLLFEEARKTQPSIIFFDEIDGLAPVRSSKQEQIHASIVSTLLALMDGMDGRGQVIVIGATNRPDNIDPALRRPGRFDREFYFPLPDIEGRKSIINIHTKDWGLDDDFKDQLARLTKGYGGADLRALCTESALNAMQRTYPQIYFSKEKLVVDPTTIKITAKDFMLSIKKIVASSERSTSSGAAPLPKNVEPLLQDSLTDLERLLDKLIPIRKKTTALEEAMFELDEDEDGGFGREALLQEFNKSRVFRPRLLICGRPGMGQAYIGAALLNHFEGLHVQSFDLPTLFNDPGRVRMAL